VGVIEELGSILALFGVKCLSCLLGDISYFRSFRLCEDVVALSLSSRAILEISL
jgi:hypothetical protein